MGEKEKIKESLQEHKDIEDMDISNDPDSEEMNPGGSDNNDEGVKDSVEDENIDVCKKVMILLIIF